MTKEQLNQLSKVQERYRSQIPKLKYYTNSENESKENPASTVSLHNYGIWIKKLLKYYTVLSPQLAAAVKSYLSNIDVDKILEDDDLIHENIPQLNESEYPLITRLAAMNAITDTLSEDFSELVEEETLTNIFPTLANILVICAPNSEEDRTENLSEFFSQI